MVSFKESICSLWRSKPILCISQHVICIDHRRHGRSKRMLNAPLGAPTLLFCLCGFISFRPLRVRSERHKQLCVVLPLLPPAHRVSTHLMHSLLHSLGLSYGLIVLTRLSSVDRAYSVRDAGPTASCPYNSVCKHTDPMSPYPGFLSGRQMSGFSFRDAPV